jgi:hypothetical protein
MLTVTVMMTVTMMDAYCDGDADNYLNSGSIMMFALVSSLASEQS